MTEKELLKKSGFYTSFILFFAVIFWFLFSIQTSFGGYTGGPVSGIDTGINSRATTQSNWQVGSSGVFVLRLGIENVTGSGSSGYMTGTNTYYPRIEWTPTLGTFNFVGTGSYPVTVQMNGVAIPSAGSVSGKIDIVGGTGTTNILTNTTLAGIGTITASFGANGLVITPAEYSAVNNASSELQAQITTATGSISSHVHTGSDGTTQVSHTDLTSKGTQTHTQIDDFIASKASASGIASLDANSLVVQNPASGTSTPGINKTVMSDGTSKISDNWLSNNITKLGTPTTDSISEGSTNKYHTDARVNAAIGSLSVNVLNDTNINMANENDFVKIVGGQLVAGSSSVAVAFSEVTGSASASQLPLISGLLGSATSTQLPTVVKLYGTTTEQVAGAFGQLYVQSGAGGGGGGGIDTYTKLVLHMDNPGTSTFTDSSLSAHTITAVGNAIGTTTAKKFGTGAGSFPATGDALSVGSSTIFNIGTDDWTVDTWVQFSDLSTDRSICDIGHTGNSAGIYIFWSTNTNLYVYINGAGNSYPHSWTPSTGVPYHLAVSRSGSALRTFVNGTQIGSTGTSTTSITSGGYAPRIGSNGAATGWLVGYLDEFRLSVGIARWTGNFTPPTAPYSLNYTQYSAKYADPVNGNTVFEIFTPGTATTEASYIYNNATTTVWGLGTNTAVTGTSSGAYAGWTNRPIRVSAVDIGSSKEIKDNIKTIKIKPDLLDAEGLAKQNYIANNKIAWIAANSGSYTTMVNETGTGSVVVVDTDRMELDYSNYIELEWSSDLNQDVYTETVQKQHEKGFWQMYNSVTPKSWNPIVNPLATYEGFIVEEMPDVVKGDDGQSINIMSVVAYMSVVQQTLKADTIFALSTLKELLTTGTVTQQKIDYVNDRLEVLNP